MTQAHDETVIASLGKLAESIVKHFEDNGCEAVPFIMLVPSGNTLQIIGSIRGGEAVDVLKLALSVLEVISIPEPEAQQVH